MKIQVCTGKSCKSRFSEYIIKRIESDKVRFSLENITIESCPCLGECKQGPNVLVDGKKENFCDPIKVSKIMFDKIKQTSHAKKPQKKEKQDIQE